jgi:hypothetical protein
MLRLALLASLIGCGGGKGGPLDPDEPIPCTAEAQEVPAGEDLTFEMVDLGSQGGCPATHLITTREQLETELGVVSDLDDVDFAIDRVVLGISNPVLRFATLATTGELFVGEEPLCQGIAPSCVAYVLRDVTSDVLTVIGCPYNGPDPCLAP